METRNLHMTRVKILSGYYAGLTGKICDKTEKYYMVSIVSGPNGISMRSTVVLYEIGKFGEYLKIIEPDDKQQEH